ncbi:MAG: class I SAM-dependent methyltransferase [Dethiosulfatibacter sp.]|nr:class I SAM-dependent methyltransferase [Dethiosulfatibacter sp.]
MGNRIDAIIKLIDQCNVAADIGTDHAYVPELLINKGICNRVIATDLNDGPYKIAKRYIKSKSLSDRIDIRLGDGLQPIDLKEVDTIIIAGMGGLLIREIIDQKKNEFDPHHTLVLQPMHASDKLRHYLLDNGFELIDEELAKEEFHFYEVIKAKRCNKAQAIDNEIYLEVGKALFMKKHSLLRSFIENKIRINDDIIRNLELSKVEMDKMKMLKLKNNQLKELMNKNEII